TVWKSSQNCSTELGLIKTNTEKTKVMTCVNEKIHVRRSEEVHRNTMAGFHTEKAWRNRKLQVPQARGIAPCAPCQTAPDQCRRHGICGGISVTATPWTSSTFLARVSSQDALGATYKLTLRTRRTMNCRRYAGRGQAEQKAQYAAAAKNARALEEEFTAYGEILERVEVFKYLGRHGTIMICMQSDIISKRLFRPGLYLWDVLQIRHPIGLALWQRDLVLV
ncbi:hypothetical protein THAOC_32362, partial [Thalassiosira oceanica]